MRFLPIVGRELRVAARRRATFWVRSGVALAVLAAAAWIFLMYGRQSPRDVGQMIFYVLTGGALLYCLLAGLRTTADCLSEEKRDGTLGLLFLTDLKGYDVVLGKLVANSLNASYGMLAIVPVLGIPLLMGGVTVGEFGRMAAVLMNTLFFSLCVGMFASAISKSGRKAMGATFFILLFFAAGIPALGAWLSWHKGLPRWEEMFGLPCPLFSYAMAQDRMFKAKGDWFYWSVGTIHVLGWGFLALASWITPRTWQDRPAGVLGLRWRERWLTWSHGDAAERKRFRDRLLDRGAYFWLASRPRQKPAWVWGMLGGFACVWVWGIFKYRDDWFSAGIYAATAIVVNLALKGWLVSEAGRQLIEDRRIGALELLLSTPLTVPEILRGQRLALQRQFLGPVLLVLFADILMLIAGSKDLSWGGNDRKFWLWGSSVFLTAFVMDLVALYWVGMWQGLAARNPRRASGGAALRILGLPCIVFGILVMILAVAPSNLQRAMEWGHFLGLWFLLGLAADIWFGLWARRKLLTEFRLVATQRFSARVPIWKRVFKPDPQ